MTDIHPYLIGIAGGTGAGKSTLARELASELGSISTILICDNYYKSIGVVTDTPWMYFNFDDPASIELDLFADNLLGLKQGHCVNSPIYDFKTHTRSHESRTVVPCPIIIAEGILLLHNPRIREALDLKVYVDLNEATRFQRRLTRDMNERGRTEESVRTQYLNSVKPMHDHYVEPSKNYADLIVSGSSTKEALSTILSYIPVSRL